MIESDNQVNIYTCMLYTLLKSMLTIYTRHKHIPVEKAKNTSSQPVEI